jgi:hypothetical protein
VTWGISLRSKSISLSSVLAAAAAVFADPEELRKIGEIGGSGDGIADPERGDGTANPGIGCGGGSGLGSRG